MFKAFIQILFSPNFNLGSITVKDSCWTHYFLIWQLILFSIHMVNFIKHKMEASIFVFSYHFARFWSCCWGSWYGITTWPAMRITRDGLCVMKNMKGLSKINLRESDWARRLLAFLLLDGLRRKLMPSRMLLVFFVTVIGGASTMLRTPVELLLYRTSSVEELF